MQRKSTRPYRATVFASIFSSAASTSSFTSLVASVYFTRTPSPQPPYPIR